MSSIRLLGAAVSDLRLPLLCSKQFISLAEADYLLFYIDFAIFPFRDPIFRRAGGFLAFLSASLRVALFLFANLRRF